MKKTFIYLFAMILAAGLSFTSCDDPYANQIIAEPTVNTQGPLQKIDLAVGIKNGISPLTLMKDQVANDSIALLSLNTAPTLLDPAAKMIYEIRLSPAADFATYQVFNYSLNKNDFKVSAADLNAFLLSQNKDAVARDFFVQVVSYLVVDGTKVIYSLDKLTVKATPYVKPLKPFTENTPKPYYIIGMANGAWNNSIDGLGVSIYPLNVIPGDYYTSVGTGTFTYTGYFWASRGFKLIRDIGSWDEQWGAKDGVYVHNDGGSSDIKVAKDGYYTITLDSENNILTITPANVNPQIYNRIDMAGGFNGWSGNTILNPSESSNNHVWYTTLTVDANTEGKFRANNGWDINWGSIDFPIGIGVQDGKNIPIVAGTYTVIFNDITGNYYFIKK